MQEMFSFPHIFTHWPHAQERQSLTSSDQLCLIQQQIFIISSQRNQLLQILQFQAIYETSKGYMLLILPTQISRKAKGIQSQLEIETLNVTGFQRQHSVSQALWQTACQIQGQNSTLSLCPRNNTLVPKSSYFIIIAEYRLVKDIRTKQLWPIKDRLMDSNPFLSMPKMNSS